MALNYDSFLIARDKIMSAVSIPDYYNDYVDETIFLDRYNKDCCPLHDEDSPSFFFFENTGTFHCFGCGKTGGVVELHYHIQHRMDETYTKTKAILDLAKLYSVKIPSLFDTASLSDIKEFNKHQKLGFKPKEKLVKPRKKVESDMENKLIKLKDTFTNEEWAGLLSEFDEIFFRNGDIDKQLKELDKRIFKLRNSK